MKLEKVRCGRRWITKRSPFRYLKSTSEIIRLAVTLYFHYPPSLLIAYTSKGWHPLPRFTATLRHPATLLLMHHLLKARIYA